MNELHHPNEEEMMRQAALLSPAPENNRMATDPSAAKLLFAMAMLMGGVNAMGGVGRPGMNSPFRGLDNLNPGRLPTGRNSYPSKFQDLAVEKGMDYPWWTGRQTPPSNVGPASANLKAMNQGVPQLVPQRQQADVMGKKGVEDADIATLADFARAFLGMKAEPGNATFQRKGPSDARPY